jgi:hypothetical protein
VFFLAAREGNGLRDAVALEHAIGQVGKDVVLGGVRHLQRSGLRRADVV